MLASNAIYSFGILQIIPEIQIRSDFPRVQNNKHVSKQLIFFQHLFSFFYYI